MGWPYEFITLSDEDKALRRNALDLYAAIAHFSAFVPALVFLLIRLVPFIFARLSQNAVSDGQGEYEEVPRSPVAKARRMSGPATFETSWNKLIWWLGDDVCFAGTRWGQRDQWVLGFIWTLWLVLLSFLGTGKDYLHLTKRIGIIAVSQMPIQYLLSLKALNPFAWAFRSSHEHVNRYHRVLGRIIFSFVVAHLILYNYFFIMKGAWLRRMTQFVVLCGSLSAFAFFLLTSTSMVRVMAKSYRLFFVTHLLVAISVPVMLFFHAHSARIYVVESIAVFVVDLAVRRLGIVEAPTTLEMIPGTNLVKAAVALPAHKANQFRSLPGSHIYLSIPQSARTADYLPSKSPMVDFLYNPFTIASVNEESNDMTLVARKRDGPMSKFLAHHATNGGKIHLGIDGPYGALGKHYQDLVSQKIGRILLFAGGVGATFALPIYQAILNDNPMARIQLIWAIRGAGDATWAVSRDGAGQSVLADKNIELFLTGEISTEGETGDADAGVELSPMYHDRRRNRHTSEHNRKRPDIGKIIDATFRQGTEETVAVLVCGPIEMSRDVRSRVRPWVMRGRKVWWHDETFGW